MTFKEQAESILSTASMLRHDDAVTYVAAHIEMTFKKGERAGLEMAGQLIASVPTLREQERVS